MNKKIIISGDAMGSGGNVPRSLPVSMRQSIFVIGIVAMLFLVAAKAEDVDAYTVMQQVDERNRGQSWIMNSHVLLIDKNKKRSERQIRITGKMYGRDEKTLTYVREPARIRGTGILSYDWLDATRENESWLYLPDLGKVTRLTTANRADYFLGTDFTYGDLEGLEVEDFNYHFDKDEQISTGQYIVIAEPVSDRVGKKYGYKKIRYWVDADKRVILKAQYWLKDNGWVKYYRQFNFKQVEGVWFADREQMLITRNNQLMHSTVITRSGIRVNTLVDDGLFTTNGLERGGQ